jgi:hypothetical protein
VWKPERGAWRGGKPTVDIDATIGAEVLRLADLGAVDCVIYDPYQLHSVALTWEKAGIRCVEMPQTSARVEADQSLYDAILGQTLAHCGDPVLTEHVLNAVAVETPRGFRLAKEKTSRKIDAAVALSMSHHTAKATAGFSGVARIEVVRLPIPTRWDVMARSAVVGDDTVESIPEGDTGTVHLLNDRPRQGRSKWTI